MKGHVCAKLCAIDGSIALAVSVRPYGNGEDCAYSVVPVPQVPPLTGWDGELATLKWKERIEDPHSVLATAQYLYPPGDDEGGLDLECENNMDPEVETRPLSRPSFWRRPWFMVSVTTVGGAALTGLVYWFLKRNNPDNRSHGVDHGVDHGVLDPTTNKCDATVFGASEMVRYEHALSCDCYVGFPSDWIMRCKPNPRPSPFDEEKMMVSGHQLATLRLPPEFTNMTAITGTFESPMRNATMDDWNNLNWVACGDTGGRILCTVGEDPLSNLVGHYFSVPFEFGFPTVWRTIVRNLKPDTCSFQCHTRDETEHLLMIRRGMASAKWAGIDLKDASEDELYQLGRQAHNLTTLSQTTGDCFEVDFASLMRHPLPWKRRYTLYQVTGFHIPAVKFATDHRLSLKKTRYRHDDYDLFCHVFKDENDAKQKLQEFWKHERMLS